MGFVEINKGKEKEKDWDIRFFNIERLGIVRVFVSSYF